MEQLEGRAAVVTGAASGIGLALATRLGAVEGMRVVMVDVDPVALAAAAGHVRRLGVEVHELVCDVADAEAMDALGEAVDDVVGPIHLLCNNAGVTKVGPLPALTTRDWSWVLGVNLWGVIHGVRVFLPRLLAQDEGHVVNTASVLGLFAPAFGAAYNVSKFGVVALSETLFHELALTGSAVGVSVLCPGWVATELHDSERTRPPHLRNDVGAALTSAAPAAGAGAGPDRGLGPGTNADGGPGGVVGSPPGGSASGGSASGGSASGGSASGGSASGGSPGPDRLLTVDGSGAVGGPVEEAELLGALKAVIDEGMPPAEVAGLVVDAVRRRQFWVPTHDSTGDAVRARADSVATRTDPPMFMPE